VEAGVRGARPRRAAGGVVVKVAVERDRCIGSGMCVLTAPAVFDQDPDEAVVVLLEESPPETERAAVQQAVDRCPAAVIRLLS
jgi:ferredoxin